MRAPAFAPAQKTGGEGVGANDGRGCRIGQGWSLPERFLPEDSQSEAPFPLRRK